MKQKIYTVSQLTTQIKSLLEENFPIVWVTGEISNFSVPASGHFYFSLKDKNAQISAVMFRGQNSRLRFVPEGGMQVTGIGRIGVYEPRGTYQIIFEHLEPKGIGALQVAFEQLKTKLAAEGLFDAAHKLTLPFLPQKIHLITSPTGAVVHDMIQVIQRRFPNIHLQILPVQVQGPGAVDEMVDALSLLNELPDAEVGILARGGGSLEDLQAFNDERLARAVFASRVPLISAVGHETDFTIADFVSDLRAPTPSVAAELVIPIQHDLKSYVESIQKKMGHLVRHDLDTKRMQVNQLMHRLVHPRRKIDEMNLRVDDLSLRLIRLIKNNLKQKKDRQSWKRQQLCGASPLKQIDKLNDTIALLKANLLESIGRKLHRDRLQFSAIGAKLQTLNPLAILERGYSITRAVNPKTDKKTIVFDPDDVSIKQDLEVIVAKGRIDCTVKGKQRDA